MNVCPSTLAEGFATYSPLALKRLFGGEAVSHVLPYESMDGAGMRSALNESRKRLSLSGAQAKYPMMVENGILRLTREGERATHILKPRLSEYENSEFSPANEHLTMQIAEQVFKIPTAASGLCFFQNGEAAYITRRYDIDDNGSRIPQEDIASVAGITSHTHGGDYKYDVLSYEEIAEVVKLYVKTWKIDLVKYFDLLMFNFLFSNGDAHLKNFSLLRRPDGDYGLAPAYDLINTQLHIADDSVFALSKGLFAGPNQHKECNMTTGHTFLEFGCVIGLSERIVKKEWERFCAEYEKIHELTMHSFLSDSLKEAYFNKYEARRRRLQLIME